ncbi:MAG: phosphoribosylformylglycinamidine cyclo-ligase [Acidimicrobiia bacterium]|nr:phosphoribosylformylglycinamidine cyclo-ligase [Acidimicrobiia bacterium]
MSQSYRDAGVDLAAAEQHVGRIAPLVTATWYPSVVGGFGGFAAGIELPPGYDRPVLMLSTDGVGTKLEIARRTGLWDGVGFDLVAMCVDDLVAAGAKPLAFVDYLAVGSLDPDRDTRIVAGIASACREAGCALLGGETAEHPGVMDPDHVDLAGAALGVVERGRELDGAAIRPGDIIIGLPSPNLRSNGFSLVRRILEDVDLQSTFPGEDATFGEVLLRPSVLYSPSVIPVTELVKAGVHVTGGGLAGNVVRVLPEGTKAVIDTSTWRSPNVFEQIRRLGALSFETMAETFNLGIGFCLIAGPDRAGEVLGALGQAGALAIGKIESGVRDVELI